MLMQVQHEHFEITRDVKCDPAIADHVATQEQGLKTEIYGPCGVTAVDLDGRFRSVRTQETNLGNLIADILLHWLNTDPKHKVHAAFFNAGSLRSDRVHSRGALRYKDVVDILPYADDTAVIEISGQRLLQVLENGVSQWPKTEGRFLQVRSSSAYAGSGVCSCCDSNLVNA